MPQHKPHPQKSHSKYGKINPELLDSPSVTQPNLISFICALFVRPLQTLCAKQQVKTSHDRAGALLTSANMTTTSPILLPLIGDQIRSYLAVKPLWVRACKASFLSKLARNFSLRKCEIVEVLVWN